MSTKDKSGLEAFLEEYLKNREVTNGPDSFETYKRERGKTYDADYRAAVTRALNEGKVSEYGKAGEAMRAGGLSGGYREYMEMRQADSLGRTLDTLAEERDKSAASAKRGYIAYLNSYDKKQESLKARVVTRLVKDEVYDPDTIYTRAIEAGLNPKEASAVIGSVRSGTRDAVMKRLLDMIYALTITPEGAVATAEEYGLPQEDIDYIREAGEKYRENYEDYSEELLAAIEARGSKSTGSHNMTN